MMLQSRHLHRHLIKKVTNPPEAVQDVTSTQDFPKGVASALRSALRSLGTPAIGHDVQEGPRQRAKDVRQRHTLSQKSDLKDVLVARRGGLTPVSESILFSC
jgi:hypothetical protein